MFLTIGDAVRVRPKVLVRRVLMRRHMVCNHYPVNAVGYPQNEQAVTLSIHIQIKEGVIMSSAVDREKIAQRAYQIYEQRGKRPGSELDDWIKAEQELMDQGKPKSQSSKKKSFPY